MVLLTRHEESIKEKALFCISRSIFSNSFFTQAIFPLWFLSLFELFLLLPFAKSFPKFSGFPNLENFFYSSFSFPFPLPKRIRQGLTAWILFVSLFSLFPKEQRTNRLNSFVPPFSLVKEFKTTQSENSFDSSLSYKQKISKD